MTHDDSSRWDAVDEAAELLREREFNAALRELDAVLKADPDNQYAWNFLGILFFERGEFEESAASYREALKRSPKYLGAAVGLGHAQRMAGKIDEAMMAAELALTISRGAESPSEDGDAHWLLALCFVQKNKPDLAIRHAEAFLASNPEVEAQADAKALIDTLRGQAKPLESVN